MDQLDTWKDLQARSDDSCKGEVGVRAITGAFMFNLLFFSYDAVAEVDDYPIEPYFNGEDRHEVRNS